MDIIKNTDEQPKGGSQAWEHLPLRIWDALPSQHVDAVTSAEAPQTLQCGNFLRRLHHVGLTVS